MMVKRFLVEEKSQEMVEVLVLQFQSEHHLRSTLGHGILTMVPFWRSKVSNGQSGPLQSSLLIAPSHDCRQLTPLIYKHKEKHLTADSTSESTGV